MRKEGLEPPRVAPPDPKFTAHEKSTTYDGILPCALTCYRSRSRQGFQAVSARRFDNPVGGGHKIGHSRVGGRPDVSGHCAVPCPLHPRDIAPASPWGLGGDRTVTTQVTTQNSARAAAGVRGPGRQLSDKAAAGCRRRLCTRSRTLQFLLFFSVSHPCGSPHQLRTAEFLRHWVKSIALHAWSYQPVLLIQSVS